MYWTCPCGYAGNLDAWTTCTSCSAEKPMQYDLYGGIPPHSDDDTSLEAAVAIPPRAKSLQQKRMTQGQGRSTEWKERGLGAAFTVSLKISNKKSLQGFRFWHVDLNCGSGFNEDAGCYGSPIAFLRSAEGVGRQFRAFFVDQEWDRVIDLEARLERDWPHLSHHCYSRMENNAETLPVIAELIRTYERKPSMAMGTILSDPNGWFGKETPHEQLQEFSKEFPRIDLVFNLNVTTYQLGRGQIRKGVGVWPSKFWPTLKEVTTLFNRSHWLIREVTQTAGHHFVLLIGRNMKVGEHKNLLFHHLDSPIGQEIIERVDGTSPTTAPLFPTLQDVSGVSETPGVQGSKGGGHA